MTIWTFGDSFSRHFKYLPESWVERTAKILDQPVKSTSRPLTTLEFTFHKFNQMRDQIEQNDIVIVTLTNIGRRWFFKDRPFRILDLDTSQEEAIQYYTKYLNHFDDLHNVFLTNFLCNLNYITEKLNLHTIVLPNFYDYDTAIEKIRNDIPAIHIAAGRIGIVSDREIKSQFFSMQGVDFFIKSDIRINHLIKSNHTILSDKVVDNIKNKTFINLNHGFVTNLLDMDLIQEPEFYKNELFNGMSREYNK